MPSGTTIGAQVMLSFGEQDVKREEDGKEDANFNHELRSVRPECPLLIVRK